MVVGASLLFPSTSSGNWWGGSGNEKERSGNWGEGGWGFFVVPFGKLRKLWVMGVWASLLFPSTSSGNWKDGSGNWGGWLSGVEATQS